MYKSLESNVIFVHTGEPILLLDRFNAQKLLTRQLARAADFDQPQVLFY